VDTTNSRIIPTAIGVGAAANLLNQVATGIIRQRIGLTALADNATIAVSDSVMGFVFVQNSTTGVNAIVAVIGGAGTLIFGSTTYFSGTKDTASKLNVYAESGAIYVQNKTGGSRNIACSVLF
jgi:hypothetical protein